ncbi:MAG: tetraacyldisaccharide 4'-kinase [Sulfurovum sp.]|nr:tetraacyldisaccharide 4'-kinase [Sulfurovum sp.]
MFYDPIWYHHMVSILLLPTSLLYATGMLIRRKVAKRKRYAVPIISVGNLVIGGSGKTPLVIALADALINKKITIISRGYGRQSSGMVEVSRDGEVICGVGQSGDEAMLMALSLPEASIIVSEDRALAIELAIDQGAELVILDDGFNRVEIEKFEILLEPVLLANFMPLPSGPFREFAFSKKYADMMLRDGADFERVVSFENLQNRMLLVTAIADPKRLDPYLPEGIIKKVYLKDHAYFDKSKLEELLQKNRADSLLVTGKDLVKIEDYDLPISKMKLKLRLKDSIIPQIEAYIKGKR